VTAEEVMIRGSLIGSVRGGRRSAAILSGSIFRSCHHSRSLSRGVDVVVVDGAKRHGEFIADLQAQLSWLCAAHVMRLRGRTSADEARLAGNEAARWESRRPTDLTPY
jgi:hypothetical protein